MRRLQPLLLTALLIVAAGCDTLDEGNVVLSERSRTFEFRVDANDLTVGEEATVDAEASATFQGDLDGFSRDEIVSARVTKAEIRRSSPLGSANTLGALLRSAQVAVTSGGAQQVASGSSFGAVTSAALSTTGAEVASMLRQSQFSTRLTFVPDRVVAGTDYVFNVTLTFAIEVEGL